MVAQPLLETLPIPHMVQSGHRLERSGRNIVDEAMDGGVIWNGLVLLHNGDIPLHTGLQVCTNGHEVEAMDVILGLLAQTLSHFLQAFSRLTLQHMNSLAIARQGRAADCKDSCKHYAHTAHTLTTLTLVWQGYLGSASDIAERNAGTRYIACQCEAVHRKLMSIC